MAEKILNTRVQLKYDSLTNWQNSAFNGSDASKYLKKGEVAIVTLGPNKETNPVNTANQHPLLFKVGTGAHKFEDLPFASALAADVYAWAKKATPDWTDFPEIPGLKLGLKVTTTGTGPVVTDVTYNASTKTITVTKGTISYSDLTGTPDINDAPLTLEAGAGLSATKTVFTANDADAQTFTVSHGAKPTSGTAHATTNGSGRTYVTEIEVDSFGHIAGVKTATEVDQDLTHNHDSIYSKLDHKHVPGDITGFADAVKAIKVDNAGHADTADNATNAQEAAHAASADYATEAGHAATADNAQEAAHAASADNATTAAKVANTFTVNGVAFDGSSAKSITIDAASLGLESAMHFIGAFAAAPTKAFAGQTNERNLANGDVYLNTANNTEYVYSNNAWVELGNEGSHALKTVTITGDGYLTGGGDLSANRTIDIASNIKTKIDDAYSKATGIAGGSIATVAKSLNAEAIAQVQGITVTNATNAVNATKAADADKLGGQAPDYYATTASVTAITKDNGTIDTKIAAYNKSKNFGDIITHDDAEYVKEANVAVDANNNTVAKRTADGHIKAANTVGHSGYSEGEREEYADCVTTKTDVYTMIENQPDVQLAHKIHNLMDNDANALKVLSVGMREPMMIDVVQTVETTKNGGLKVAQSGSTATIDIDDSVTFVFNCGSATELV